MKTGFATFTLTTNSCDSYKQKFKTSNAFLVLSGCVVDSYYKPLREIQKQIIKQIVELAGFPYIQKNLTFNMYASYESREISITWSEWTPFIVIEMHLMDEESRFKISLENEDVKESMELFIY
jgi:hypothetical protein